MKTSDTGVGLRAEPAGARFSAYGRKVIGLGFFQNYFLDPFILGILIEASFRIK